MNGKASEVQGLGPAGGERLGTKAVRGSLWISLSTAISVGVQALSMIILARMLTPADFGLFAMLMVFAGLLRAVADFGVGNAIIQRQTATQSQLSSMYWLSIAGGVALCALFIAISPLAAAFYHQPAINALAPWIAATFLLAPLGSQFGSLLQRDLRNARIAIIEISANCAGLGTAIWLAWRGTGALALVGQLLAMSAVRSAMQIVLGRRAWRPDIHFSPAGLRPLLSFSGFQSGERIANFIAANADYFVIGRFCGAGALGFYKMAFDIITLPLRFVNPIGNQVMFPAFARKQDDTAVITNAFLKVAQGSGWAAFPFYAACAAVSGLLVRAICGSGWTESAVLLALMVPMGIAKFISVPSAIMALAKGLVKIGFKWNCIAALCNMALFPMAAYWQGARGVAAIFSVLSVAYVVISYRDFIGKTIGLRASAYLAEIGKPLTAACIAGIAAWLATHGLRSAGIGELWAQAIMACACGLICYGGLAWWWMRRKRGD